MPEPTLSDIADKIERGFDHDRRLRAVEIEQASTSTSVDSLTTEVRTMKQDLLTAIAANAPKPIWPVVGGLASVMMVLMALFAVIYSK
ncbi:MAG TPA: hypothetical protein VFK52_09200 [Nocardioidaceae bacterium]|nr:hypothetical protein [Nocardioidaceae bacterium]